MTLRRNFGIRAEHARDWLRASPELLLVDLFFLDISALYEEAWQALFTSAGRWGIESAALALTLKTARTLGLACAWHTTFAINSLCHHEASPASASGCRSRNLRWLGLLSLGESHHGNHHARSKDARHAPPECTDLAFEAMRALHALRLVQVT